MELRQTQQNLGVQHQRLRSTSRGRGIGNVRNQLKEQGNWGRAADNAQRTKRKSYNQSNTSNGVSNVRREEKKRINQDRGYLQGEQLPNNASTDQIFNASYQNQGLQPQNLNEPITLKPEEGTNEPETKKNRSRFSRRNDGPNQRTNRGWNRPRRKPTINPNLATKPGISKTSILAKKGFAKGQVTAANSFIFLVGTNLWMFVQLPLAIISLVSFAAYAAILNGLGFVEGAVAWWFDIENIVFPLFAITTVMLHLLGILTLILIYITYNAALLKPLSGSKPLLKQAAFVIALIFYTVPLLNLAPWGLLVIWVVWLYPE